MIYKTIFTYLTEKKAKNVKPFSVNGSNPRSQSYDSRTYLLKSRCYISLMDVAQNLIFITSYDIYF